MDNYYPIRLLGEVCAIGDGAHAKVARQDSGRMYLTSKNIGQGTLILDKVDYISGDDFERIFPKNSSATRRAQKGDILIGIIGTFGNAYLYEEVDSFGVSSSIALLRPDPNVLLPEFLLYVVKSNFFKDVHQAYKSGSVQGYTNIPTIKRLPIPLPPLPTQRLIASVLASLDDKIELNRRMNATLEALAAALFKHWFVDNPEAEGWEDIELGQFADIIDCLHTKKPDRQEEGKPLLQLWNILDNGLLDMTDTYYITEERYYVWVSRIEASPGDCVITNTGRVAAVAQIPEGFKAALGRNMTGIRCKKEFPYPTFLLECLLSDLMKQEIHRNTDVGTILDSLNVRNIPKLRFKLPTNPLLQNFEQTVRPVRVMMEKNLEQSRTLAALRDTLLPRLMRGEVRVSEL